MSDEKLDALGLLGKLRDKGATSGANRGLQVIAANTAIKVISEMQQRIKELEQVLTEHHVPEEQWEAQDEYTS